VSIWTARWFRYAILSLAFAITLGIALVWTDQTRCDPWPPDPSLPRANISDPDVNATTLEIRQQAQLATLEQFEVFIGFRFTDIVKESGITFLHQPVDDPRRLAKAVHYDHGTGLAAADVDGDGLLDIYFVNQLGPNQLWKNLGEGRFKDITADAGVAVPGVVKVSASFADIGNTGHPDLYVTTVRGGNRLFRNDGHGHFTDVSKDSGVDYVGHSSGAVFFDYDNDGFLDLFLVNVGKYTTDQRGCGGYYVGRRDAFLGHFHPELTEHSRLYRNLGNYRFADATEAVGLPPAVPPASGTFPSWSGDATFADLTGTGYPSLYVLNMQGQDHYYENQQGKRFVDKTLQYFPKTPFGSMGIKIFDWDNNGLMDVFVTDMHSDMLVAPSLPQDEKRKLSIPADTLNRFGATGLTLMFGNAFYQNLGNGRFEEISDRIGAENLWPWGVSVGDLNADGWDDLFISSGMNGPFPYTVNSVLLNNRGKKFLDAEFILGVEPRRNGRTVVPWYELNCTLRFFHRGPCYGRLGWVTVMGTASTSSSAIVDLNNDGALDIVTNDFGSEPMVLLSNLARRNAIHWVKINLEGTRSNRQGLGAMVRVMAGGNTYSKYNDGKSGYLSQSALPLYFGLGDAAKIDRIEVRWPSGTRQVVSSGLSLNSTLSVVEPP